MYHTRGPIYRARENMQFEKVKKEIINNKAVLEPWSRLLSRAHTFVIIVILDLKIHQRMWIH